MKLRRLELLRYGHLSDVALDFPDAAALHVVHGANEAGKSTTLAAIADGLFGFGHRTEFDFLHGGPQLRVGFTLVSGDGVEGNFIRRKGRRDTLTDTDNQPVPEEAMRRFLGGATRELFEQSFGLDGTRLRAGGQDLLRSGGEAGESLLAGSGLLNLRAALEKLEDEARSLHGDGRGKRRLAEAADAWSKAQRETNERAVAPRAWQEAEAAHAAAVKELAAVQAETQALAAENSRLQRVRRVAHLLTALDSARTVFAALEHVPRLPPDAAEKRDAADAARREAIRDAARETAEAERLAAILAALPRDASILRLRDAIDALAARRAIALQAETDLPKVRAAVASHRAKVAEAVADLGTAMTPEAARDSVPPARARQAVQRLINERAELAAKLAAAEQALTAGERRRDRAAEELAALPPPPSPALLRRTIDEVRGEGPLDAELDRANRALATAENATATALAALPLWSGDLATLAACPVPLVAATDAAAVQLDAEEKALTAARATVTRLAAELTDAEAEIVRLSHGSVVPTREAVAEARARRNEVWRTIRHAGSPPEAGMADIFETHRDAADRLADQRADDAQRVADFLSATARQEQSLTQQAAASTTLSDAEAAVAESRNAWHALWADTGLTPDSPAAMAEWRRLRTGIIQLAEREAETRRQTGDTAARRDIARSAIAALVPPVAEPETLAALLRRADTVCAAAEEAAAAHFRRTESLAREEAQLPALRDAVAAADTALRAWADKWAATVPSLNLPADVATDSTEAALQAWARIAEAAPAWRSDEQRVDEMIAAMDGFAADTRAVLAHLEEPNIGEASPIVVARVARRLAEAVVAERDAEALAKDIAAHRTLVAAAIRLRDEAETVLTALRAAAGAADDGALARVIEQATQRDAATDEIAGLERALLAQGDGLLEPALREETAGTDPDTAAAQLEDVATRLETIHARRETLTEERTRAEVALAKMHEGQDAAAAAQEAENALADARAAAERYAAVHVARVLLRAGIERFRTEQQGPLLRKASAHFALLTGGRYARLGVDQDSAGRTLLHAVPAEGSECPIEGLSEGARDQLYLALRIATIETHVARSEPLPFIADDLLVNFDDTRATAALRLLAELDRSTQVILFTHHDHIADIAGRQEGVAIQRLTAP